ncbi:MAG: carboxylating nicotinate-nucleotide diphosphorylase [Nostocoides sp.]
MSTKQEIDRVIATALLEDLGPVGDVTTLVTVSAEATGAADIVAREAGVLSGCDAAQAAFRAVDPSTRVTWHVHDGGALAPGTQVATIEGASRAILTGERTALNLLGHLSGIATRTAGLVGLVEGTSARIIDTRKTTPGLRSLEKDAVVHGGGANHRFGLYDAILVKDNHIALGGGLHRVLERLAERAGHLTPVEIEVDTLDQLQVVLAFDADRIAAGQRPVVTAVLLDNMTPQLVAAGVERVRTHPAPVVVEVSGGVTEATVVALAKAGPDVISLGALTHSVRNLDLGLDHHG